MDRSLAERFPCPCCGNLTLDRPGLNEICPICLWEDDVVQLRWPDWAGGANASSLIEGQQNFSRMGACTIGAVPYVRPPSAADERDPIWRPVDPAVDDFEPKAEEHAPWPKDRTVLYWWRPEFWRR